MEPGNPTRPDGAMARQVDADAAAPPLWSSWLAQAGAEVAVALTGALEQLQAMAIGGRVGRADLDLLRRDVERARHTAIVSQQLARLAGGLPQPSPERVELDVALRQVLAERRRMAQTQGTRVVESIKPAVVVADASLLSGLLQAALDWALGHCSSPLTVTLDAASRTHSRLQLRFLCHRPQDARTPLDWELLQRLASLLDLQPELASTAGSCQLALAFPRPPNEATDAAHPRPASLGFAPAATRSLAGHHLLVLSARRDLRAEVRDAVRPLGLMIDFVASLDDARSFCRDGMPHALVVDASFGGDRVQALQRELMAEAPTLAVIAITDGCDGYCRSATDGLTPARVGRLTLADGLQAALRFELTRHM